jgi:hypothetical protein
MTPTMMTLTEIQRSSTVAQMKRSPLNMVARTSEYFALAIHTCRYCVRDFNGRNQPPAAVWCFRPFRHTNSERQTRTKAQNAWITSPWSAKSTPLRPVRMAAGK